MSRSSRKVGAWVIRVVVLLGFATLALYARHRTLEQQEALEAMNESLTAWQALLDSADYGVAVLDEEGRVKQWNPALERWTGYSAEEMVGQEITILMHDRAAKRHAEKYSLRIGEGVAKNEVQVVHCQIYPRDREKPPLNVRINAFVVRSKVAGRHPYAIALIARQAKVVEVEVDEAGDVQQVEPRK